MADGFGAVGMVVVGTAMNAAKDIGKHHDPFTTLLAGAALAFGVSLIGTYLDPRLGSAFAGLFLLSSFLVSGTYVFGAVAAAVSP